MKQPIYEVNIELNPDQSLEAFMGWLRDHVEELEKLPGFLPETKIYFVEGEKVTLSVHYHLVNREALEIYLREFAKEMRAKLPIRFREGIQFSRRILFPIDDA